MRNVKAYLIVICDKETNAIKEADIWSSPEWQQSMVIPDCHTYVAYELSDFSFQTAIIHILYALQDTKFRYHYLLKYLKKYEDSFVQEYSVYDESCVFMGKVLAMCELSALSEFAQHRTQHSSYGPLKKAGWYATPSIETDKEE